LFINAELSQLPITDGRKAERRIVNLAAALREAGATTAQVQVVDIAVGGFKVETSGALEEGAEVWLKLPGFEAKRSHVIWVKENQAGCEFETELHPAELEAMVAPAPRRGPVRNVFAKPDPKR
jgi:hypothetical protein